MKLSDIVSGANLTLYPKVALVLFLLAFVIVLVRTLAPGAREEQARAAALPLDDANDRFAAPRGEAPRPET